MNRVSSVSWWAFIACALFIFIFRVSHFQTKGKELSFDVLGYYLPLPSTFIHDDPLLTDYKWLKELNSEKEYSGTLYMISQTPQGEPMYFFLLGMSFLYLPFFLLGHLAAGFFGFPQDGFSQPYEWSMVIGAIFVALVGLSFFRKVLRHFFNDAVAAIILILIVLGTNWSHHCTIKNLETVNYLFTFASITFWYTIRWHQEQRLKYLLGVGLGIVMAGLIKPSEVLVILFPLLYGVYSKESLIRKANLIYKNRVQFLVVIVAGFIFCLPQLAYWYIKTGHFIFDSYKNPGVGLDFLNPHTWEVLFSFRKGWFIYTPIMIFSMFGFANLYKRRRELFWAILIFFIVSLYIMSSWTEWWYGAAFSFRPMISLYPFLAIPLGFFIKDILERKRAYQYGFGVVSLLLISLNLFQQWQQHNGIIHPTRMTKKYYFASFLKTEPNNAANDYLLVHRDFGGNEDFRERHKYVLIEEAIILDSLQKIGGGEFAFPHSRVFGELTKDDHLWVEVEVEYRNLETSTKKPIMITNSASYRGKTYGWKSRELAEVNSNMWQIEVFTRLTPPIRSKKDKIKTNLWNPSGRKYEFRKVIVRYYERQNR